MKSPALAVKVTLNGHLGQGEVFSTGFWVASSRYLSSAAFQTAVNAFTTDINGNSVLTMKSYIDAAAGYDNVKAYYYGDAIDTPAVFIGQSSLGAGTGVGTGSNPLQTALVASLRTATLTSSGRGRMYFPFTGRALVNHEVESATVQTIATAVKSLFASAVTAFGSGTPGGQVCVWSPTKHTLTPVTNVIVDSRTDVQRRRAQKEAVLFTGTATIP